MNSSISGNLYETRLAGVLKIAKTAGSNKHVNDLRIPWGVGHIDIEAKQTVKAEFGQKCAVVKDGVLTIPDPLFQDCIAHTELFGGAIPPFLLKGSTTYADWSAVEEQFRDEQYHAPSTVISEFYKRKGNAYIQIRGLGLYHTGEDVAGWGVPYFKCPTYLRVRCKRHGKKCPLTGKDIPTSVMTSFWVKTPPPPSPFSLDSPLTLPAGLQSHLTSLMHSSHTTSSSE
jgi:hypothetical protein